MDWGSGSVWCAHRHALYPSEACWSFPCHLYQMLAIIYCKCILCIGLYIFPWCGSRGTTVFMPMHQKLLSQKMPRPKNGFLVQMVSLGISFGWEWSQCGSVFWHGNRLVGSASVAKAKAWCERRKSDWDLKSLNHKWKKGCLLYYF